MSRPEKGLHLPLIDNHKDPFDRFLIATAQSEKIPIVTADQKFKQYSALITLI
jgi:PIN domain nuclease of toxin-antitoxin system